MQQHLAQLGRMGAAIGLAAISLMILTGLNHGGAAYADTSETADVSIVDFAFEPATITVTRGTDVRWTNNGAVSHTTTSDTGLWDSGSLGPGGVFTQTFDTTGVYSYHCALHPEMQGRVVVVTATLDVCPTCDYTTIGAALAAAGDGDTIRVASGTYTERLTISKTIHLEGGWDISFTVRAPGSSAIDAQRAGRALTLLDAVSPTVDGFALTGGDATSETVGPHQGGGVYIAADNVLLINNIISDNLATTSSSITDTGRGGGIFVSGASSSVVISANQILSNVAGAGGPGTIGQGGGVFAQGAVTLANNLIASNQARSDGSLFGYGGGAHITNGVVRGNQFISNSASNGGGIASLSDTLFEANLSRGTTGANFLVEAGGSSAVRNNFILESNCPTGVSPGGSAVSVVNNTIAGCNQGVYVPPGMSPPISNNLFFSNVTAITGEGTPPLDYNGFWLNGTDFNVSGTLTGTHNVFADPLFVDPAAGDYHLQFGSPMMDAGTGAGAPPDDYDGDLRPTGAGVDIGADEVAASLEVAKQASPDPVQAGDLLTYTLSVTNTGGVSLTATITDILPAEVTPTGILTWAPIITAPGGAWTQQLVVTVASGYSGTLTNTLEVTTLEGASGFLTETSTVVREALIYLPLVAKLFSP